MFIVLNLSHSANRNSDSCEYVNKEALSQYNKWHLEHLKAKCLNDMNTAPDIMFQAKSDLNKENVEIEKLMDSWKKEERT